MIEVKFKTRKRKKSYGPGEENVTHVIINGIEDKSSFYSEDKGPLYAYAHFYNDEIAEIFKGHSFSEVGKSFAEVSFSIDEEWWEEWIKVEAYCNKRHDSEFPALELNLQIQDWEH